MRHLTEGEREILAEHEADARAFEERPPRQRHSATSEAAAMAIAPSAANLRRRILVRIIDAAENGLTDHEIETATGLRGSTVRPRRRELQRAGLICDSGLTRPTDSGREAVVWVSSGWRGSQGAIEIEIANTEAAIERLEGRLIAERRRLAGLKGGAS